MSKHAFRLFIIALLIVLIQLGLPALSSAQQEPADTTVTIEEPPAEDTATAEPGYTNTELSETIKISTPRLFQRVDTQAESYNNYGVTPRKIPDSVKKQTAADPAYWYANYEFTKPEKRQRKPAERSFFQSDLFDTVLWILIIGGFVTILILYLNSNAGLFRKTSRIQTAEETVETEDMFAIDYDRDIRNAETANDYRLATRLQFLRLLRKLADYNIIQYKADRTNLDYLMQLSNSTHYGDFFRLARHYEYTWYGQFEIDTNKYQQVRTEFADLERKII